MKRVAIAGAAGRMGGVLIRALQEQSSGEDQLKLSLAMVRPGSPLSGKDSGTHVGAQANGVLYSESINEQEFDVLIDFSVVGTLEEHAQYCRERKCPMFVGVTGWQALREQIHMQYIRPPMPVIYAANTSMGANALMVLSKWVAGFMPYSDISIREKHHRTKKDCPSGTALTLQDGINRAHQESSPSNSMTRVATSKPSGADNLMTILKDGTSECRLQFCCEAEKLEISYSAGHKAVRRCSDEMLKAIVHKAERLMPRGSRQKLSEHEQVVRHVGFYQREERGSELLSADDKYTLRIVSSRGDESEIGTHSVQFDNTDETLLMTHHALNRSIYAHGALHAARWLLEPERGPGLYSMHDVLGA
jgi:4-hydroxy-tetrahydrodipicolinate reductase